MKLFVVVSSLLAVATAAPSATLYAAYAHQPALYAAGAPLAPATYIAAGPAELHSQYHAQDELGQYSYGYNGGLSAKAESKSFDGITRGSYSYLDAENKLQTVAYTADALNGFRVAASNLPVAPVETRTAPEPVQDTPEVAAAKADHMAAIEEAKLRNAAAEKEDAAAAAAADSTAIIAAAPAPAAAPALPLPVATYAAAAPASFAYSTHSIAQPIAAYATYAAAPAAPAAIELKAPASFAYSTYTAAAPLAYAQYAAAPAYATLPVAQYAAYPAPAIAFAARSQPADIAAELPEPVQDTPEVAKAKEEHLKAVAEAKARSLQ
ncbi:ice-structuring glycoprotein-like [Anopheles merus]|uniref:ice-structuring glycoprotein-like n=1 Tax=Anopheles merus TaxID=30066 RepID=UPI001BE463F3|nr:ice-structuring glycoprotein-like [Anopheles merus]